MINKIISFYITKTLFLKELLEMECEWSCLINILKHINYLLNTEHFLLSVIQYSIL